MTESLRSIDTKPSKICMSVHNHIATQQTIVMEIAIGLGLIQIGTGRLGGFGLLPLDGFYAFLARLSCTCCQRRSDNFTKTVFDLFIGSSGKKPATPKTT